jgi:hypothetical protein
MATVEEPVVNNNPPTPTPLLLAVPQSRDRNRGLRFALSGFDSMSVYGGSVPEYRTESL